MTNIFLGNEPGYGSVIKVLSDPSIADPLSVNDDEYDKFRFNSKRADISPIMEVHRNAEYTQGRYRYTLPKTGDNASPFLPMFQVYFMGGDGWNYPDHWISVRSAMWGGNDWGNRFLIKGVTGTSHHLDVTPRFSEFALAANQRLEMVLFDLPDRVLDTEESQQLPWAPALPPKRGQLFWQIDKKGFEVARPGYDLETATEAQKVLGDVPKPLLYFTKRVVLAPGETETYRLPPETPDDAVCLCQWNGANADHRFLPSMWIGGTSGSLTTECRWKIGGERLTVHNMRPDRVEYLLIVVGRKPHKTNRNSAWEAGMDANGERYMRFNRNGFVQLDTRYGYLPIIKSGVIENPKKGEVVRFPRQGYKPYVLASVSFKAVLMERKVIRAPRPGFGFGGFGGFSPVRVLFVPRYITYTGGFSYFQNRSNFYGAETFTARVYNDRVVFDFAIGGAVGEKNYAVNSATGLRLGYYIIGVPSFD